MKRSIKDFFVSSRSEPALHTAASAAASAQPWDIGCTGDSAVDLDKDTPSAQQETVSSNALKGKAAVTVLPDLSRAVCVIQTS